MFDPRMAYMWEMETVDGTILRQYNEDKTENTWKNLPVDQIVRVTFIPLIPVLPVHNCLIDIGDGTRFVKRFASGFLKLSGGGSSFKHYLNCVVTNRYRFYVFSDGRSLVTSATHEVNL